MSFISQYFYTQFYVQITKYKTMMIRPTKAYQSLGVAFVIPKNYFTLLLIEFDS